MYSRLASPGRKVATKIGYCVAPFSCNALFGLLHGRLTYKSAHLLTCFEGMRPAGRWKEEREANSILSAAIPRAHLESEHQIIVRSGMGSRSRPAAFEAGRLCNFT